MKDSSPPPAADPVVELFSRGLFQDPTPLSLRDVEWDSECSPEEIPVLPAFARLCSASGGDRSNES